MSESELANNHLEAHHDKHPLANSSTVILMEWSDL